MTKNCETPSLPPSPSLPFFPPLPRTLTPLSAAQPMGIIGYDIYGAGVPSPIYDHPCFQGRHTHHMLLTASYLLRTPVIARSLPPAYSLLQTYSLQLGSYHMPLATDLRLLPRPSCTDGRRHPDHWQSRSALVISSRWSVVCRRQAAVSSRWQPVVSSWQSVVTSR